MRSLGKRRSCLNTSAYPDACVAALVPLQPILVMLEAWAVANNRCCTAHPKPLILSVTHNVRNERIRTVQRLRSTHNPREVHKARTQQTQSAATTANQRQN